MTRYLYSLKFKIVINVMVLFCVGMFLEIEIWRYSMIHQAENMVAENLYSSMKVANQNFESTMKDIDRVTALVSSSSGSSRCVMNYLNAMDKDSGASDSKKVEYGREVYQYLFQLCSFKYYLNGMGIYNLQGSRQVFGSVMSESELLEMPWLEEFLESEEDVSIIPDYKRVPVHTKYKERVFSIVRKIRYGKQIKGIVVADVRYQIMPDYYNFEEISNYQLLITDYPGNQIIYPEEREEWQETLSALQTSKDEAQLYSIEEAGGKKYLFIGMEMPITHWNVYGIVPYRNMIADFLETLKRVLIITIIIALFVCVGISMRVLYMTRGLSQLTEAVQGISADYLELGTVITGRDEVGILYQQICHMLDRIQSLIGQIREAENEKRELEIIALQEQINPHFLYNTLNIISMLASFRGIKNIQDVTVALSDILHLALNPARYISVKDEVKYVRCYLEIMEYKYPARFSVDFQVDDAAERFMIPKMILQPIVENSLQHGIVGITRSGQITIMIKQDKDFLIISVKDNGQGMSSKIVQDLNEHSQESQKCEKHIGVRNVRDRLLLIYGDKCKFCVSSRINEFTEVEIRIPLGENGEADR